MPRSPLTTLAKLISKELASGRPSPALAEVGEALAAEPGVVTGILDLLVKEAAKKRPDPAMIAAFTFMIGQVLEVLRFAVERNYPDAVATVSAARARILDLAQRGTVHPGVLMMVVRQFIAAKLDPGDELRSVMAALPEGGVPKAAPNEADIFRSLALAMKEAGDLFVFQAHLAEQGGVVPDGERAAMVAALLNAPDPSLREAAPGWLLDAGPATRRATADLLLRAARDGKVSGTMLRRMITMRNWLPEDERQGVDAVIRACRQGGVECAALPKADVRDVMATAIDGSGAQSLFIIIKDGRKQAVAAALCKHGVGVRDGWVQSGLSKAELERFVFQVETGTDCVDSDMVFVRVALQHALAEGLAQGTLPAFGLVDAVERVGLAGLNPAPMPLDDLLARLHEEFGATKPTAARIAKALKESATWEFGHPFLDSWFEDDGAVDLLLARKKLTGRRRVALVLDEYLSAQRSRWATLMAWMALTLRHDDSAGSAWKDFAIVARELAQDRPLGEIPVMSTIARKTVEAWEYRTGGP